MKILTIGNSFANNPTVYLDQLIAQYPTIELILGKANSGGCSLEKHWNLVGQCDLLKDVKPYNFTVTGKIPRPATLAEALASEPWDYITRQRASILSWKPETFFPFIDHLHGLITKLAPQAQPIIHQTWAYRIDATIFDHPEIDQAHMYSCLCQAYNDAAKKLNCRQIPSGAAFQNARKRLNYLPDPNYDFAHPTPLELRDQKASLNIGYRWQTGNTPSGKAELGIDFKHANEKGCYVANAVWFEMFTGKSMFENSFCPAGVSKEERSILMHAAHEAVMEYGGPLDG